MENKLKELRKKKNLSQTELSYLLNVAQNTISQWENNVRKMDISTAKKIADFFDVTTDYLLGYSSFNEPNFKNVFNTVCYLKEESPEFIISKKQDDSFYVTATKNSIARIKANDKILVRPDNFVKNGKIAVIKINGLIEFIKIDTENKTIRYSKDNNFSNIYYKNVPIELLGTAIKVEFDL